MFVAMPLSGIGMPSWSIILRNRSRTSAISMESMLVPRILTPSSLKARAMFSGEIIWAFPHIYVRSGYILWVARFAAFPPNLIKRSLAPENIRTKPPASLRPKGSLSLTRKISRFNHSNSQVSSYIHFPNLIINSNEVRTSPRNRNIEIC